MTISSRCSVGCGPHPTGIPRKNSVYIKQRLRCSVPVEPFLNLRMVRDLAEQLDAERNAAAACRTIDNLLAGHGIATTKWTTK